MNLNHERHERHEQIRSSTASFVFFVPFVVNPHLIASFVVNPIGANK